MVQERSADRRLVVIVLDSVGVGELPDAAKYGDSGSNTVGNLAKAVGGLDLPNLQNLGLGNLLPVQGVAPVSRPVGAFGKMREASAGKDTTTGHWELAGIILKEPFPVYPQGFPDEIISEFTRRIGRPILGNKAASGTEIIKELGAEHLRTGYPIVYTSADSVFQIAAHEAVIPVPELYQMCGIAREMLVGRHGVGRVIARPFIGAPGEFTRTGHRKDFSLSPPAPTVLDAVKEAGFPVFGIGKIEDIFAGQGLTGSNHTTNNHDGLEATLSWMTEAGCGFLFVNLVDFDMVYGHRNDISGYARALEEFDGYLPKLFDQLRENDVLLVTADHGCDPTMPSTDHSREHVPLFVVGDQVRAGAALGVRESFADVSATIAEWFGVKGPQAGTSFLGEIVKAGV